MLTQVEVSPDDPAFKNPTKPIGSFMTKEEADAVAVKAMSLTTEAEVEAYLKSVAKH